MAAILNSIDGRRRGMSGDIYNVISKSGLVENVGGVEVEIALLSHAVQKLRPPSWISSGRKRRIFSGMAQLKSPYPKMGVDTRIVSLAGRWAQLEGSGVHPTPAVRVTKSVPRCSRVNVDIC